jgi:hypothetical protein
MAGFFTCRGKFRMALGRVMNSAYGSEVIVEQEIGMGREVLVALIGAVMTGQANRFICSFISSPPNAFRITIHAAFFTT